MGSGGKRIQMIQFVHRSVFVNRSLPAKLANADTRPFHEATRSVSIDTTELCI
jgi:hypothetical protein